MSHPHHDAWLSLPFSDRTAIAAALKHCRRSMPRVAIQRSFRRRDGGRDPRSFLSAFTLVEVALAMGIVAFAIIPILGLLPAGLHGLREAISSTVESEIVQAVSSEILLTKYDRLTANYGQPVTTFYNEEGMLVLSDAGKRYTVTVVLKNVPVPAASSANPCAVIQVTRVNSPSKSNFYRLIIPKE